MTSTGGMGVVQRLLGVFTSPSKTFEDIAARPGWDWLVPVLLVMLGSFVLQSVALPKIDVDQAVKDQMKIVDKMTKGNLPEAKRAEIEGNTRKGIEAGKSPVRRALNTLIIVAFMLLVPALYRGIAAAMGRKATYKRLLAGYTYTWMIYLIPIVLTIFIVMSRSEVDPNELNFARLLKSNVAAFLDFDTTSKPLLALLSSVDVFDIWGYIVGSIAVSKMTDFTRKGAMAVVGTVWGLYIVIKVCLGAFLGMMG
jgi:Yip1-like protein